jgi:quinol monooxygenase YgiN
MLMTHITMTCDNAADFAQLKALSAGVLEGVRAEPGCVASYFAVDVLEPLILHAIARYRDQAALDAHIREPATQRYMAGVQKIARVVMEGSKYEVASQAPLVSGAAREALNKLKSETA